MSAPLADVPELQPAFSREDAPELHQYEVLDHLGEGATATVKLCRRVSRKGKPGSDDELVAVKIMEKKHLQRQRALGGDRGGLMKEDGLHKLKQEIAIMKKLIHPNVVQLIEVIDFPENACAYLVLEYVHGGPIMTWDDERRAYKYPPHRGAVPPPLVAQFFMDALTGLQFLHANNIIHRDLKPDILRRGHGSAMCSALLAAQFFMDALAVLQFPHANNIIHRDPEARHSQTIMTWHALSHPITHACRRACDTALDDADILVGRDGTVKIADFGVAHYFANERVPTSDIARSVSRGMVHDVQGTWYFWAPEACHIDTSDRYNGYAADTWALGVCLWVFAFWTLPFDHQDPTELFELICAAPLRFPQGAADPDLRALLEGLLDKSPARRLTLAQAAAHRWQQRQLAPAALRRTPTYRVVVSDADVNGAITLGNVFSVLGGAAQSAASAASSAATSGATSVVGAAQRASRILLRPLSSSDAPAEDAAPARKGGGSGGGGGGKPPARRSSSQESSEGRGGGGGGKLQLWGRRRTASTGSEGDRAARGASCNRGAAAAEAAPVGTVSPAQATERGSSTNSVSSGAAAAAGLSSAAAASRRGSGSGGSYRSAMGMVRRMSSGFSAASAREGGVDGGGSGGGGGGGSTARSVMESSGASGGGGREREGSGGGYAGLPRSSSSSVDGCNCCVM
ncbi:kinase-like domain-containing protein [Tribonema minus]|uniref:Kinase-like domain-containing protein n=1 Tax=Tribonema minus TaxID=303371 RepID=A0A836C9M4_9STRA|nr:kinase-like domain-containing protein [Tribonema minus]